MNRQISFLNRLRNRAGLLTTLFALVALLTAPPVHAGSDFSTGVSDDRLSLPEGPGSLEGVGDNVSVDPNMALMRWGINIDVPKGFAGVTPEIKLGYSSGAGSSLAGIGWSFDLPFIERMTARGLPVYDPSDDFVVNGSQELVRVSAGNTPISAGTIYRARFEKEFVRYLWHDAGSSGAAGYWEAQYPDGRVGYFGADSAGVGVANAVVSGRGGGSFRYHLVEMVDVHGHKVRYDYIKDGFYSLPDRVGYVFKSNGDARFSVAFSYENRTDLISDCASGVDVTLSKRLKTISIYSDTTRSKRYELTYDDETLSGGLSRLSKVETYGLNNELYPIVEKFGYSRALGAQCTTADCGQPYLIDMGSLGVTMTQGRATLIDVNGDALPDVVDTSLGGNHRLFLNRLESDSRHHFAAPTTSAFGSGHQLGTAYVQPIDVNGDGFTDLVNGVTGDVLINKGLNDWASQTALHSTNGFPNLGADPELRFLDYDNDKRIDVVHSDLTTTRVWRNEGDNGFVEDTAVELLGASFEQDNVQFADMNGDGLLDAVRVVQGQVSYRRNLGWGHWATWATLSNMPVSDVEAPLAMLEDLNGDGLADLVVVTGTQVKYALNRNGASYDAAQTITSAVGGSIPERTAAHTVLCADMNGNGSQDIVWIDGSGGAVYLELFPVRPHLMTKIENGIGRVTEITYGTSVQQMAVARAAGSPWLYKLPYPMNVVVAVDEYDLLSNLHDVVSYRYRDGYYDGVEKQYRGYEMVEQVAEEDPAQEAGLITSYFNIGENAQGQYDPYFAGLLLRQMTDSGGHPVREFFDTWADCTVSEVPTPTELTALGRKPIRHVCKTDELTYIKEGKPQDQWVHVGKRWDYDGYGNATLEVQLGVVAIGAGGCEACATARPGHPCGPQCTGDEKYDQSFFVPTSATGGRWMIRSEYKSRQYGVEGSQQYSEQITYYDGDPFVGLGEGTLTKGLVSRVTERVSTSGDVIDKARSRYDQNGNVVELITPNGSIAEADDFRRAYAYDADGLNVLAAEIVIKDPAGAPYRLRRDVQYEAVFNKPVEATAWMRVEGGSAVTPRNASYYTYDNFGRVSSIVKPGGDTTAQPTQTFVYELASPSSRIITRSRSSVGGSLDTEHISCQDGRGREYQQRTRIAANRYQVAETKAFNLRGNPVRTYLPYESTSAQCDAAPPQGTPHTEYRYDATDREIQVIRSDSDLFGTASVRETRHEPLVGIIYDEQDLDAQSPQYDTPLTYRYDGLGRLIRVERLLAASGTPEAIDITYDELGRVRGYVDPAGHEKTQQYDLLGRVSQVTDPNAGITRFAFDAAGNITSRTDARGRIARAAYDGDNRLLERWDDSDRTGTLVQAHYDGYPACDAADCSNLAGKLGALSYPGGEERFGYDVRGREIYGARQLEGLWFETRREHDNLDRVTSTNQPDGRVVTTSYDGMGRVVGVAGVVEEVSYDAQGRPSTARYHNGTRVENNYDSLMRLAETTVTGPGGALQGLDYLYDRVGNVLSVHDQLTRTDSEPSASATFDYDAWYRLTQAAFDQSRTTVETLTYQYDAIDNLVSATSSLGATSKGHVGSYTYDSAHPGAAIAAGSLIMEYDAAGFMTGRGDRTLSWDYLGRLTGVTDDASDVASFGYGASEERVSKVEAEGVTLYVSPDFEVRDGITSTYVRLDKRRVARLDSDALQTRIYSDVAPLGTPDSEINAGDAWLAHADAAGIVDVTAETSAVDRLLLAAARRLLFDGASPERYFHHDFLGSITLATDGEGAQLGRRIFHPYGELRFESGVLDRYGFTGQERDDSTGLIHFANRSYDPFAGRWLSPDPQFELFVQKALDAVDEAIGAYTYCGDNPTSHIDPLGLKKEKTGESDQLKKKLNAIRADPKKAGSQVKKNVLKKVLVGVLAAAAMITVGILTGGVGLLVGGVISAVVAIGKGLYDKHAANKLSKSIEGLTRDIDKAKLTGFGEALLAGRKDLTVEQNLAIKDMETLRTAYSMQLLSAGAWKMTAMESVLRSGGSIGGAYAGN